MGSKKKVKQKKYPIERVIKEGGDPNKFYSMKPSWNFHDCDNEMWSLFSDEVKRGKYWDEILPFLQKLEKITWNDILVVGKKKNHRIDIKYLNPGAQKRLEELHIEADALTSLSIKGTHRIYGCNIGSIFNVVWVDFDHGDNDSCVCRSRKKHT